MSDQRTGAIEVIARAICCRAGIDPEMQGPLDTRRGSVGGWGAKWEQFKTDAEAILCGLEMTGYVVKPPSIVGQHPDDDAVDFFAKDMKRKLAQSRAKGRGGWADPLDCSHKTLAEWFVGHLTKTNPDNMVDLANLAMMLHLRQAMPHHLQDALQALNQGVRA